MSNAARLRLAIRPLMTLAAVALPSVVLAAVPAPPSAGSILQQVQPAPRPAPPSDDTGLTVDQAPLGSLPATAAFRIDRIEIIGASRIDPGVLHALVADKEARDIDLADLSAAAARITEYYRAHGYPLARAIIPAQTIQSSVARIEVIEARYGAVGVDNHSRVDDRLLRATLKRLRIGDVIAGPQLDRSLLLLSDIPGLSIDATLKPGAAVGTSDLQVVTLPAPAITGDASIDNGGDRYTGRTRASGSVSLINPLHHGDVLSLSALTSGDRTNYGRLSYETLLDGDGARLGGSYSALKYKLGGPLAAVDAHGQAQVASLWVRRPFVRGRLRNLYGHVGYDHLVLADDVGASGLRSRRRLDNLTATLSGDIRDGFLGGAANSWSAAWAHGRVRFDDAQALASDAATAHTRGDFSRWNLNLARLQRLGPDGALYLSFAGQWADGNLDPSQKMIAGGPYTVRAYDIGAASGDLGYLFTAEVRRSLPKTGAGEWQAIAFVDTQQVTVNKTRFSPGANRATLSGAGVGLSWTGPHRLSFTASIAAPVGPRPQLVGATASSRGWLTLSKAF